VAYTFGFRKGELLGLKVRQVNLKDRTIQLMPGTTKNDKGRTVSMTEDVYQRLTPCVKGKKPDDSLFTWEDGSPVRDFRVTWASMCKAAKVSILLHDFRRSAIRNMIRAGFLRKRLCESPVTLHVPYSTATILGSEEDLADAAEKLENRRNAAANAAPENSQIGRELATGRRQKPTKSVSH
jgi:integrase